MPGLDVLASFAIASLALLVVPGPAVVYIVNRGMVDGRKVALASVLGLTFGNLIHALMASVGISALLIASSAAFNVVKWLGVAYLVGVGIRTLKSKSQGWEFTKQSINAQRAFRQGVAVNVLNPKVALFFLAFLPQFVDQSDVNGEWLTLLFGSVFVGLGLITDSVYALVSSSLKDSLINGQALAFFRRWVSGAVFIGLGLVAAGVNRA